MSGQFSFGSQPTVKKKRSRFDLSHSHKTTMNVGTLYPVLCQEVLPGDTVKINSKIVTQCTSAFLKPVIDNLFAEVHFFFVPNRLVSEWEKVMGENKSTAWAPAIPTPAPQIAPSNATYASASKVAMGTVGERLGLPLSVAGGVQAIPYRSFAKIYDEWFRDQNNIAPMAIKTGSTVATGTNEEKLNSNAWSPNNYTGLLPHVKRMQDYFTSALPAPQKGDPVEFAGASLPARLLPVTGLPVNMSSTKTSASLFPSSGLSDLMQAAGYDAAGTDIGLGIDVFSDSVNSVKWSGTSARAAIFSGSSLNGVPYPSAAVHTSGLQSTSPMGISNMAAYDAGTTINPVSMNEFVYALSLQRMLIKDAIGGTRYAESLLSHWGVVAPDQRLQRPEYLGGRRFPLSISQVAQTAPTEGKTLGELGAYSLSNGSADCLKGFVEHGYLFGVMFIRQIHSYSQGIERHWLRKNRVDFYDPCFANIGQQPIWKRELFAGQFSGMTDDEQVFGYKEPWAEYKYGKNLVTGQLRPDADTSLDIWTFTDDYENAPSLNADFIEEDPTFVDRSLAVPSSSMDQFIVDIWFDDLAYRVMPVYSKFGMM